MCHVLLNACICRMGQQGKRREEQWHSAAIVAAAAGFYSAISGAKQGKEMRITSSFLGWPFLLKNSYTQMQK